MLPAFDTPPLSVVRAPCALIQHIITIEHNIKMVGSSSTTQPSNAKKTEMVTLPSGASYPAFLEPLTKNEQALLDTYDKIRHYEKEAARLKAEEAKRRLEEADERYRAKVRERERAEGKAMGGDNDDDEDATAMGGDKKLQGKKLAMEKEDDTQQYDDDEHAESDEDDETIERRRKRAEEISRLRKDVDAAKEAQNVKEAEKEAAKQKEEAMRRELLGEADVGPEAAKKMDDGGVEVGGEGEKKRPLEGGENDDVDATTEAQQQSLGSITGPSIKKKQRMNPSNSSDWDESRPKPSLIANIGGDVTPIHDFSKKLGMSKTSFDGTILFPNTNDDNTTWSPPDDPSDFLDGSLQLELPDFDATSGSGNNTLAIKFHAPQESARFSINISAPNHDNYNDILFHFNPRHFQGGGKLVINDRKDAMWGNDIKVPLSTLPLMFGVQACTLIVQINEEGFDVFVEGVHCARLEHRTILPKGKGALHLQFPSSDDYGNPETWMVYRVWWGRKESMATGESLSGVAGVNLYDTVHPRKLFVSGLTKLHSDPEVDLRRAELERAFRKYGGPSGAVFVSVQKDSTFAFVEVASEQQADLALLEMANKYRINKARRTKHEALLEERAAKEAAETGMVKESADWD